MSAAVNSTGAAVTRNVASLIAAQVTTAGVAFLVTVAVARHLGPSDYGILFLATAFVAVPFIIVDLGQGFYGVSTIARDRGRAGVLLGTGTALRIAVAALLVTPTWAASVALGYPEHTRTAIMAAFGFALVGALGNGFGMVFRGLERLDHDALSQVISKVLYGVASFIAIWFGAGLLGIIGAQSIGNFLGLAYCFVIVRRLRIPNLAVRRQVALEIVRGGAPFLVWNTIITVQLTLDSVLLSKLASQTAIGWYGAASRLTQVLILPTSIVGSALFPTLSRLFVHSQGEFNHMTRAALKWMLYVGGLSAAGTYLFADVAVAAVYRHSAFGAAADILRVMSIWILALFLNFVLGTAVMAANRQRLWIVVKGFAVVALVVVNFHLIPWCQERFGNGGIGAAGAGAIIEWALVVAAVALLPAGVIRRSTAGDVVRVAVATAVMMTVKHCLDGTNVAYGVAASVLGYTASLWALGGISVSDARDVWSAFRPRSRDPEVRSRDGDVRLPEA